MSKDQINRAARKKTGGRKKGTPNKDSLNVEQRCVELGVDVVEGLIAFYKGDYLFLNLPETIVKPGFGGIEIDELSISPDIKLKALTTLAKYIFPLRKAVDHTITDEKSGSFTIQYKAPPKTNE